MLSAGIDLHKKVIVVCVVDQDLRRVVPEKRLACADAERVRAFFASLGPFQAVVEATAGYEWLWQLLEPLAARLVLAHPGKMRVIAESVKKTDRLDAQVLAEFLARGMVPEAYRPTPRQRELRTLVRHRQFLVGRVTALKNRLRHLAASHNADRRDLFTEEGRAHLLALPLSEAERAVAVQMLEGLDHVLGQRRELDRTLRAFARQAPQADAEARAVLASIPQVGPVTVDVVVAELGDVARFRSAKAVSAYAGLAPARRESAGKAKDLGISKRGSPLLRWALVEAAWRLAHTSPRWRTVFEGIAKRRGKKRAAVAVARRLLTVMAALLRTGQRYRLAG